MKSEDDPIVIELYEMWNKFKSRFNIVNPRPKSFVLNKSVQPVTAVDGSILTYFDLSDNAAVLAAGSHDVLFRPPVGTIYTIRHIVYGASDPTGSGAGTHSLTVNLANTAGNLGTLIQVISNFGATVEINQLGLIGNNSEVPAAIADQYHIMRDGVMISSYDTYLKFTYLNSTDVSQTANRVLRVFAEVSLEGAQ